MASKTFTLNYSIEIDDVDREIEIEVSFSKGHDAYFSKSFGNYLPGDPDEIVYDGACWSDTRIALTDEEFEKYVTSNSRVDDAVYDYLAAESDF